MRILFCIFIFACLSMTATAQYASVYAYSRALGAVMVKSDVNTMVDYYNERNKTTVGIPRFGGGYKMGLGVIMLNINMGMSQHEHYLSAKGKKGELPNGYREFNIKHRSRNGVMGYFIQKESATHQINIETGIGRSVINTGFVYNDGFKSYGPESPMNGSYWVRSFQLGAEYVYQKKWKNNLSASGGVAIHHSFPLKFGRFEDQMDYKRTGTNYVLYKDDPVPGGFDWNDPAHVIADYTFLSLVFGVQYTIEIKE